MSSEPHAPCSEDIKVHLLHCGCFLAVTIGPDTWECLQLHVMPDESRASIQASMASSVHLPNTHGHPHQLLTPCCSVLTSCCSAPPCFREARPLLALCSFRGEQLNLLGFLHHQQYQGVTHSLYPDLGSLRECGQLFRKLK